MLPQPRLEVLDIAAYVPGESAAPGSNRVIKLSSNEGAFGPPPSAVEAAIRASADLQRYPDGGSAELRRAIGARFNLDPARIVCGTGSDELIQHLASVYGGPGTDVLTTMHAFSMYQIAGTYAGSRVLKVPERELCADVDRLLAAATPATRVVFLANPNNPTGTFVVPSEVARLRAGLPEHVLLVLDGAYAEYIDRPDYDAGVAMVDATGNTVMLRSFSKAWGLGGARVGWMYAPPAIVDAIGRVRGAFNVALPAQAAAVAALSEPNWIERSREHNFRARDRLASGLRDLGLRVYPSEANFVLADFGTAGRARETFVALKARGIILRATAGYDLPHCLRITVGLDDEVAAVLGALREHLNG